MEHQHLIAILGYAFIFEDVQEAVRCGDLTLPHINIRELTMDDAFMRIIFRTVLKVRTHREIWRMEQPLREPGEVRCSSCERTFANQRGLSIHFVTTHAKETPEQRRLKLICCSNACP